MSTRYESRQDLVNEEEVVKIFTGGKHPVVKLGKNDIDFLVKDIAYIEVKCSPNDSKQFNFQVLSLIKVVKMQEYSRKLPTYLVYRYSDCIMYINVQDIKGNVKWFERKKGIENRKDATNDKELVIYIPKCEMKVFTKLTRFK